MMCSKCKKRPAMVFLTRMDGTEPVNEGLCLTCAQEMGIKPVTDIIEKMGLSPEDVDEMGNEFMQAMGEDPDGEDFEAGGAQTFPFLQNLFGQMPNAQNLPANPPNGGEQSQKEKNARKEKEKKRKYLDTYCQNLTRKAKEGKLDRIVGRDKEIYRVIQILNRRQKNNPCLIGEPGVGKTAIAEGIAQRIASGDVPFKLQDKELYLLDLTALVAGTQFRGQFEGRVKGLIEEIRSLGNIILFVDEVHNLVGAGDSNEGSMNAANIMKPALSRGEIQMIGATTFNEYRKHIEKDAALERRFQPVPVEEPSIEDTVKVLMGIKRYYEVYHKVQVPDRIVRSCVLMSERYITDRFLPDKAIDLLDEACSCASLNSPELVEYQKGNSQLKVLYDEIEAIESSTSNVDYERLARLKAEELQLKEKLKALEETISRLQVTEEDLAKVVELWTGIPSSKVQLNDLEKIRHLEEHLKAHVIGQDEACKLVAAAVRRNRVGISSRRSPASFIFVGPTGVGKTELVKVLSKELFDTADPLIRLDMSEYMDKYAVSRIVGAPPGYVGYDEAGQLTEKVRRRPYSVILFDEIEKAHPDVMNILLQILDEGRITDAHGRVVNFENTVIVMTSNAGSERRDGAVGFNKTENELQKEKVYKALSEFLRPEFLGRVDEIVVFRALSEADYEKIAKLMIDELKEALEQKGIALVCDGCVYAHLAKESFGKKGGARDLRNTVRREVEDKIASAMVDAADRDVSRIALSTDEQGKLVVLAL